MRMKMMTRIKMIHDDNADGQWSQCQASGDIIIIMRMTMVIMRMRPGQALELVERQDVLFAASEGGQIMVMLAMMPNIAK